MLFLLGAWLMPSYEKPKVQPTLLSIRYGSLGLKLAAALTNGSAGS
jgi:hypothetical protein